MDLIFGNTHDTAAQRDWVIGNFIDPTSPLHSDAFEVKWSTHKKGAGKGEAKANAVAKSISIIRSGKFQIDFPDQGKSIVLSKEGDYAYFGPGVRHSWTALEDSEMVTIRWPSIPNDQK